VLIAASKKEKMASVGTYAGKGEEILEPPRTLL
jgi:hypothetical protein